MQIRHSNTYLFIFVKLLVLQETESSHFSDWETLIWVNAEAGVNPLDVWTNSNYSTNTSGVDFSLERLLSRNVTVFRSGKIDKWSVQKPSRLRLLFLSETGSPLIMHDFNSSNASSTEWFSADNMLQRTAHSREKLNISYDLNLTSLLMVEVTFGLYSQSDEVFGVYSGALKYNSSQYFLFSADGSLLFLPGTRIEKYFCKQFIADEFNTKQTSFTNNRQAICASFCRQHNFTYSCLYNTSCKCDNNFNRIHPLEKCNILCPGNSLEFCGFIHENFIGVNILENKVNVSAFNPNTLNETTWIFNGTYQLDLGHPFYYRNGSITLPANVNAGSSLTLELSYKLVACNDYDLDFQIKTINLTNNGSMTDFTFGEIIGIVCAKLKLIDRGEVANYTVSLRVSYIKGPALLTAPVFAVQAAWKMCDCDCEVYRLLHGESPYANMTYAEKLQALQSTITKIKKALAVKKSELSATIRKKSSAEDHRVSATVIGSTIGIAVLCCSLGLIILFDLPRILKGFQELINNITGH